MPRPRILGPIPALGRASAAQLTLARKPWVGVVFWILVLAGAAYVDYLAELPSNPEGALNVAGYAYQSEGKLEEALSAFSKAIQIAPNWYHPYIGRGATFRMKGDLDRALSDLDRAVRLGPGSADAWHERGMVWRAKADPSRALLDFEKAIRLKPEAASSYFERAIIRREQGAFDRAISDLDLALQRQKKSTWYIARAKVYLFDLHDLPHAADDFAAAAWQAISYRDFSKMLNGTQSHADMMDYQRPFDPEGYYLLLWTHSARILARQDDKSEMRALAKELARPIWKRLFFENMGQNVDDVAQAQALVRWPGPIYLLFLNKITTEELGEAAIAGSDGATHKRRQCDVHFYLGVLDLQKGEPNDALRQLHAATRECPADSIEWQLAELEIRRHTTQIRPR